MKICFLQMETWHFPCCQSADSHSKRQKSPSRNNHVPPTDQDFILTIPLSARTTLYQSFSSLVINMRFSTTLFLALKIEHGSNNSIVVIGIYRPPSADSSYISKLEGLLSEYVNSGVIILGDFHLISHLMHLNTLRNYVGIWTLCKWLMYLPGPTQKTVIYPH